MELNCNCKNCKFYMDNPKKFCLFNTYDPEIKLDSNGTCINKKLKE